MIRVWLESDGRVRARVTVADLANQAEESVTPAEGVDEIVGLVRARLEGFAQSSAT